MTDEQFYAKIRERASRSQEGHWPPIVALFHNEDGTYNRAEMLGIPAMIDAFTPEERAELLDTSERTPNA